MSDETAQVIDSAPGGPVDPSQADRLPPTPQAGASGPQAGTEPVETISADEARKLRAENASYRRKLRDAEQSKAEAEAAALPDLERAHRDRDGWKAKAEALEGLIRSEKTQRSALEAATAAGAIEPAAVARLIATGEIEFDEAMEPTNVDELLRAIRKAHPRLFAAAPGNGNGGARDERGEPMTATDRLAAAYARLNR